ncbi:MAG: hypothetical protein AAF570_08535, partial [Bacteroidota bacterium]
MQNSRLWKIFLTLDRHERLRFRKFLHSPYHNRRSDVCDLFEFLAESAHNTRPLPDRSSAWQAIWPDTAFDDPAFRLCMNYLLKHLQTFLVLNDFQDDPENVDHALLDVYHDRRLLPQLHQHDERRRKKSAGQALQSDNDWRRQYEQAFVMFNAAGRRTPEVATHLTEMNDALDRYFILNKLRLACSDAAYRQLFTRNEDRSLLHALLEQVQRRGWDELPAIGVYFAAYHTATSENPAPHFDRLKTWLTRPLPFQTPEIRALLTIAINHCIQQLNRGSQRHLHEVFALYQQGLTADILLENDQISPFTYKNIV